MAQHFGKAQLRQFEKDEGKRQSNISFWKHYYDRRNRINPSLLGERYVKKTEELIKDELDFNEMNVWYITVNPDPKLMQTRLQREDFVNDCLKALRKKWICNYKFWIEYRHEGDFSSIHANFALGETKYPFSRVKAGFWSTFKDYCGNEKCVHIQQRRKKDFIGICNYQFDDGKPERDQPMLKEDGFELMWTYEVQGGKKIKENLFGW